MKQGDIATAAQRIDELEAKVAQLETLVGDLLELLRTERVERREESGNLSVRLAMLEAAGPRDFSS